MISYVSEVFCMRFISAVHSVVCRGLQGFLFVVHAWRLGVRECLHQRLCHGQMLFAAGPVDASSRGFGLAEVVNGSYLEVADGLGGQLRSWARLWMSCSFICLPAL